MIALPERRTQNAERRTQNSKLEKTNNTSHFQKNYKTSKRWNFQPMLDMSYTLFNKIYKRKYLAHHNHEIHFLYRELQDWLPKGIQALKDGNYTPQHLERIYFADGAVDQLYLPDRIFQNVLLNQIKKTFPYVMSQNCYHLCGPHGVKLATKRIHQILQEEKPNYFIRADIKSFYSSIPHYKLLQDIGKIYDDPKLIKMLKNIIINPVETARGIRNSIRGIALRGPLSQFFSGIYLKPLDDAFEKMKVSYLRYQDDIIILCKTKRQMNRCKRRLMEILHERKLSLSRKKTRMGKTSASFHFLGIHYPGTQTLDNTKTTDSDDTGMDNCKNDLLSKGENKSSTEQFSVSQEVSNRFFPHARTLRKARTQINVMVLDGFSARRIRSYLHRWVIWWLRTADNWKYDELLNWLIRSCWDNNPAVLIAAGLLEQYKLKDQSAMQV